MCRLDHHGPTSDEVGMRKADAHPVHRVGTLGLTLNVQTPDSSNPVGGYLGAAARRSTDIKPLGSMRLAC